VYIYGVQQMGLYTGNNRVIAVLRVCPIVTIVREVKEERLLRRK